MQSKNLHNPNYQISWEDLGDKNTENKNSCEVTAWCYVLNWQLSSACLVTEWLDRFLKWIIADLKYQLGSVKEQYATLAVEEKLVEMTLSPAL